MKRSFNYTGRQKINRSDVKITVDPGRKPLVFDATFDLDKYRFPAHAEVVVEAYYRSSSSYMRFSFGTVSRIEAPADRTLSGIDGDLVFFRLKVIDPEDGRKKIIGLAEQIEPGEIAPVPGSRFKLLPVNFVDLKDEVWALKLDPRPILEVNRHIPGIREFVHHRLFFGCVYPEIVRKVLNFIRERYGLDDDIDVEWAFMWLRYARTLVSPPDHLPVDVAEDWIEEVVDEFARTNRVKELFSITDEVAQ